MRPLRLEVTGFSAYRDTVVVDFDDVEFFALTGPTGSGKSSLIDAMIFALYGKVPRLGGGTFAPAISAGSDEAKVALTFEVGDETYQVARFARRTESGGGTVKEVRLEGPVSANGVGEVNDAIESVLSLSYEDFTRTVVLPQGEFARFLTAKKSERQGLLRNLLGFDLYTRIANLAKTRRAVAGDRLEMAQQELTTLGDVDVAALETASRRVADLELLANYTTEAERSVEASSQTLLEAEKLADMLRDHMRRLREIEVPENLEQLGSLTDQARDSVESAVRVVEAARAHLAAVATERDDMPSTDRLDIWLRSHRSLEEIDRRIQAIDTQAVAGAVEESAAKVASLRSELGDVQDRLDRLRSDHAAHALVATLSVGDDCPVCQRPVDVIPEQSDLPELDDLEGRRAKLASEISDGEAELASRRTELVKVETQHRELLTQRAGIAETLDDAPSLGEIESMAEKVKELESLLTSARVDLSRKEAEEQKARANLDSIAEKSNLVGHKLTQALVQLAALDPEISSSDDPVVRWKDLLTWRERKTSELRPQLAEKTRELETLRRETEALRRALEDRLTSNGVPAAEPYSVQVAAALQGAKSEAEQISTAVKRKADLETALESARLDEAVAGALVAHLRVDGFERWLMLDALDQLVTGANDLLADLSSGGFSLYVSDDGDFSVVDHRNADELRSVATLSGGETFLVSLALALSLAETLASKGGAVLDAVILDEGFGTLDDDSLEVVASVLEELSGEGLMVGVITHVKELAQRAPVRYEVSRSARGATVERVMA